MTVAGELHLCQKFYSDVWNRSEGGLEVPGKLLRMDQVNYSLFFFNHFLFMWPDLRLRGTVGHWKLRYSCGREVI